MGAFEMVLNFVVVCSGLASYMDADGLCICTIQFFYFIFFLFKII